MKGKFFLSLVLLCALYSGAWAQQFPIGIWFGGNQNAIDSVYSMGFTWIQAYGGWDRNNFSTLVLQNTRNLNVAAVLERNIHNPSFAQRMQYQAEQAVDPNGRFNYFATHQTGQQDPLDPTLWRALVANHAAGYMVQSPVPDDQYFYERMHWVATAQMRIDLTGNSSAQVVRIEIADGSNILAQRVLTEGEFGGSTALRSFEVAYSLLPPAPLPKFYKLPVTITQTAQNNPHINVRVWWHDQVNTYLDFVTLEDSVVHPNYSGAYQLFRGQRDADITNDASFFASQTTYPLLQRFYLRDEPNYNGYQPFNYVDQRILNTAGMQGSANGRGRGITATPNYAQGTPNVNAAFNRFMDGADPYELLVDAYPINADISAPTEYIPAGDAANAGIAAFSSASNYNLQLQPALYYMITNSFLPAIQTAQSQSPAIPWWYFAQVHGELDIASGQYRSCHVSNYAMLRPPSPEEIRVMVNLALAYGAKGIFYFWFPSYGTTDFGYCAEVRFPGLVAFGSDNTIPNHSSNYDTFGGYTVFTGYQRKWDAVKAINADLQTLGPILVNRDWVTAFTSGESAPGGSIVTSLTGSYIEAATFDADYIMLVNRKCHPTDVQTIEITTNKTGQWVMDDQLTHELFVSSNGVFKNITLNPGQGRLFRLRPLTTNENWSGTINIANDITIANGSTLIIQPGATLRFSSGATLFIEGEIVADSNDPANRITFAGVNNTPGYWWGIGIYSGNSANTSILRRCDIQDAFWGIWITYSGNSNDVTIDKCRISNSSEAAIACTPIFPALRCILPSVTTIFMTMKLA
jgi:hypothetical protein